MTIEATTPSDNPGQQEPVYAEPGQLSTDPTVRGNPYLAIRYAITYQVAVTQEESDGFPESAPWEEMITQFQNAQAGPPEIVSGIMRYNSEYSISFGDAESARQYEPDDFEVDWEDATDAAREFRVYQHEGDDKPTVAACWLIDDLEDVIRRMELIRDGAWQYPSRMETVIDPDVLTARVQHLLALTQSLTQITPA